MQLQDIQAVKTEEPVMMKSGLSLNERLGLIGLIDDGSRKGSAESPILADLFKDLWDLVSGTVSGSKIDRLKPEQTRNGFRMFEINAESGENLGRLNMLYLKKPLPCYYLVYVEVAAPYRKKGLGNRILVYFRDFLAQKSAIGILDNIIPENDPTYSVYFKQAWEPVESIIGEGIVGAEDNYMIYIPPRYQGKDIKESILKLVYHLKRKRTAIDMRDNEVMVQRTIAEFRDLYSALLTYFDSQVNRKSPDPLMRFMFTRFVTKLISFRRRIGDLIGYTGGDSLEQISLSPFVSTIQVKSYAPPELTGEPVFISGDKDLYAGLPEEFKKNPSQAIEALPNYKRPSLTSWLNKRELSHDYHFNLGDLMDLGFDPTRLKEIRLEENDYIFERIQPRQLQEIDRIDNLLNKIGSGLSGVKVANTNLKINPPCLVMRDRSNAYVLRRKIPGIHWEEAIEQVQSCEHLREIDNSLKLCRIIVSTAREAYEKVSKKLKIDAEILQQLLTCFVSWDLYSNRPELMIDFASTSLESIWLA